MTQKPKEPGHPDAPATHKPVKPRPGAKAFVTMRAVEGDGEVEATKARKEEGGK